MKLQTYCILQNVRTKRLFHIRNSPGAYEKILPVWLYEMVVFAFSVQLLLLRYW